MQYAAIVNGKEREVEVVETSPNRFHVQMPCANGAEGIDIDLQAISETTLSVMHGDAAYLIELEDNLAGGENLLLRGHVMHSEVVDLRRLRVRQAQAASGGIKGPAQIKSPMPGKVVTVLAKEGEQVREGQGLVVVEAMKMENELRSPKDGVVTKVNAQPGVAVDGGFVLCIVE